jgi:hypothetical protein
VLHIYQGRVAVNKRNIGIAIPMASILLFMMAFTHMPPIVEEINDPTIMNICSSFIYLYLVKIGSVT